MTLFSRHGVTLSLFWRPIRDVLQRWRICLASLVFFTIFLTNNFGVSTGAEAGPGRRDRPPIAAAIGERRPAGTPDAGHVIAAVAGPAIGSVRDFDGGDDVGDRPRRRAGGATPRHGHASSQLAPSGGPAAQYRRSTSDVIATSPRPSSSSSARSSSGSRVHMNMSSGAQRQRLSHVTRDRIKISSSVLYMDSSPSPQYLSTSSPAHAPSSSGHPTPSSPRAPGSATPPLHAGISPTSEHPYSRPDHVTTPSGGRPSGAHARRRHISDHSRPYDASSTRSRSARDRYLDVMTAANASAPSSQIQCLVADDLPSQVCSLPADWQVDCPRTRRMRQLHLKFCGAFPLYNAIHFRQAGRECPLDEESEAECRRILTEVVSRDAEARTAYCLFQSIVSRFDCVDPFSTDWSCEDCKEAYKNWVCSQAVPYYHDNRRLEPCPRYCELVENRCPYIKPHILDTYAGEQAFICRDWDDIPRQYFTTSMEWLDEPKVTYVSCHQPCPPSHASDNTTSICVSQMEKTIVEGDTWRRTPEPSRRPPTASMDVSAGNGTTENATLASVARPLYAGWICTLLCVLVARIVSSVMCRPPGAVHLTSSSDSYHRVIGLT